jgi:hypothetical protein
VSTHLKPEKVSDDVHLIQRSGPVGSSVHLEHNRAVVMSILYIDTQKRLVRFL